MVRQKPLVVSLVLAGLIATTDAGALGLGRLNVTSPLGQPLVAEVDLTVAPGEDVDSIRANIASPAVYRAANVEYQSVVQTIRAQVQRRANGQPYLRLVSTQSLNDPYLDLLLEVNSSTGRLVREYVFLLDPPGAAAAQSVEPTQPSLPAMPTRAAPVIPSMPVTRPSAASGVPAPTSGDGTSYSVRSGDTLSKIAGRNLTSGATVEQLMIAIQRANPNAFIGGNINRLRAGATLNVPSASDAQTVSQNNAISEVRAQTASWRGYVARVTDSVPSVAMDQPAARASGKVSGAVADTGGGVSAADKLKLSQGERSKPSSSTESKVAAAKALKEEQSRTAQLEKIKRDQELVITLKNEALAEAQAKAKAAPPPPAPIPPVAIAKVEPPKVVAPPAPAPVLPPPPPAPIPPVAIAKVEPPKVVAPPAPVPPPPPPVVVAPAPPPAPAPVVAPPPPPPPAPVPPPPPPPPPAPVSPPAVAKTPAVAPAPEASMFDALGDNPMPLAAAGLGILALLGAILWSRGRKKAPSSSANSKVSDPVVNTMNPDTVFGTSGLGVVKTNDMPVQSQFSRSGMGNIDSGEVDPVAEAEVYIAYGREAQAEEILREALLRDPHRLDVATKLAEISATQGKRDVFDKLAGDVAALDRNNEYKQKLAGIAAMHFPGHPLAEGGNPPSARGANNVVKVVAPAAAVTAAAATVVSTTGFAALETPTATGASEATAAGLAPTSGSLDFVLDGMTIAKPSSPPPPPPAPVFVPVAEPAVSSMSVSPNRKSLEQDLAELEASLKKATATGQMPEGGLDFTDFSTATPTHLGTVGPSMRPEMLDLSFDAGRQGFVDPTPSILDGQWHDASTKLDLARAYEEMGDSEGAREILREVMHDGDESQQAEAKAMLAKLGG